MSDLKLTEPELYKPETDPFLPDNSEGHTLLWLVLAALAIVTGAAAYLLYVPQEQPLPAAPAPVRVDLPIPAEPLGAAAESIVVPPLNQSDAVVRELVRRITSHPRAAAWLASKDLIRNFTVVVANVAEGVTPARHLPMLRPPSEFQVVEGSGGLEIDRASYARYDGIAAAAAAIDPLGAARLYATLKPRIEEAYRDLGFRDQSFDQALERAIVSLLAVPAVDGPVRVVVESEGIGYGFAAARLEALTDAQKHLLRTGPRNTRMIQASLREIALALGVRLPPRT